MELYQTHTRVIHYQEGDSSLEKNYSSIPTSQKDAIHTVTEGEDLLDIAYRWYFDEKLWYVIAFANNLINPFELTVGEILNIPYSYARPGI